MNRHAFALALTATSLSLLLLGFGSQDSLATDNQPGTAAAATPAGSKVKLDTPFSQTLTCYAGVKPYFERALSGQRTVSFDGDQLTVSGSGHLDSGRFSASGNPIARTNNEKTARLHTQVGASGGRLWFARNLRGEVVSAGIVHRPGADRVECGEKYATQWLDNAASKPFGRDGDLLVWQSATDIDLNCIRYSGTDFAAPDIAAPRAAQLQLMPDGSMSVTINGDSDAVIMLTHADRSKRTAAFVHETVRDGGQRIWLSRDAGDNNSNTDTMRMRFRFNYNLLDIEYQQDDDQKIRCVPAPLDPRRFIES